MTLRYIDFDSLIGLKVIFKKLIIVFISLFVNFFDDDKYMLTQSLVHPEILDKVGWPNKGYNVPRKFKVKNGIASGCVGYNAREKEESPAGDWIFSVSDGSRELLEFSFELR